MELKQKLITLQGGSNIYDIMAHDAMHVQADDLGETIRCCALLVNSKEGKWGSHPESVTSYMGDDDREDDGTQTASPSNHTNIPDSWEDVNDFPLINKACIQPKERKPKCCNHKNPQPCCEKEYFLFEKCFTCNGDIHSHLAKALKYEEVKDISNIRFTLNRFRKKKNRDMDYNIQYKVTGYTYGCSIFYNLSRNHANVYRWLYYAKKRRHPLESLIEMRYKDYTSIIMDFIGPNEFDIISKPLSLAKKLIRESKDQKVLDKIMNTYSAVIKDNIRCKKVRKKPQFRIPHMKWYDCDYLSSHNGKLYGINIKPYDCYGCPKSHHDVERGYDHYFHLNYGKPIIMYGTKVKFCIKIIENRENDDFYDEVCWNNEKTFDLYIDIDSILSRLMFNLLYKNE